jgi:hypothetical protein
MRAFCSKRPLFASSDVRILEAIARPRLQVSGVLSTAWRPNLPPCTGVHSPPGRGAKTKASMKVQDLPQGVIGLEPLPDLETDDAPQYPAVVQGARNNMIKFSDCIVLTRVGSFYEVCLNRRSLDYAPTDMSKVVL